MSAPFDGKQRRLELAMAGLAARGLDIQRGVARSGPPPTIPIPQALEPLAAALGVGGIPRGLSSEFIGPFSSGKATLAAAILAEAQHTGRMQAVYVNLSGLLDPDYLQRCQVDLGELLIIRPDDGPEAIRMTADLVRSGTADVMVFDSTNALSSGFPSVAALDRALERLARVLSRSPTALIFLTTLSTIKRSEPPRSAVAPWAGLRLLFSREAWLREGRDAVGYRARVIVVKNRLAPLSAGAQIELRFGGIGL